MPSLIIEHEATMSPDEQPRNNDIHHPLLNPQDTLSTRASNEDGLSVTSAGLRCTYFTGSVVNLCSATLGAGVLALPIALYQAGLIFGLILLVCSAWATTVSIHILAVACDHYKVNTYESLVEHVLGKRARNIVEASILVFCVGTAVAYLIAVGDILAQIEEMTISMKHWSMTLVWLFAMLPLSCLKRMQSLQCASSVGIASIFTLLVAATAHLLQKSPTSNNGNSENPSIAVHIQDFLLPAHGSWLSVLRACPIVFFAFSCQVNVAQIYDELPGRSGSEKIKTMARVTLVAVLVCAIMYSSISVVTLMDFGATIKPNILSCYDLKTPDGLLHVAVLAMALAVVMAFPLNVFPARVSIIQMLNDTKKQRQGGDLLLAICGGSQGEDECRQPLLEHSPNGYDSGTDLEDALRTTTAPVIRDVVAEPFLRSTSSESVDSNRTELSSSSSSSSSSESSSIPEMVEFHWGQHMLVTVLVSGGALGLALLLPNISVVFGVLGGTTSSMLGFVVPGLLGLQLNQHDWTSWTLVVAGSLVGIVTTGVTIYSTIFQNA